MLWGFLAAPLFLLGTGPFKPWLQAHAFCARLFPDTVVFITLLAATGLMLRFIDHRPFRVLGFATALFGRHFALGFATGTLWLIGSLAVAWGAGWISPQLTTGFPLASVAIAAVGLILNVVCQQLLLCGYIFQLIRSYAGFGAALLGSTVLFCAYHAAAFHGAWLPAFNVALAAMVFCLARQIADNLWFPIGIHSAWNYLLGPVLGLTVSGHDLGSDWQPLQVTGPTLVTGGNFGFEGSLIVTVTTALLVVMLALYLRAKARREINP